MASAALVSALSGRGQVLWPSLLPLFTVVRGIGILGTSPFGDSPKFAEDEFSEVPIPAVCVAPSLCGGNSYVEIEGSLALTP